MHHACGQPVRGQVVIRHEHAHAEPVRFGDAFDARDAVIDRDEDVGPMTAPGRAHDLGREPIAVLEAIRHEVRHVRAESPQRAQPDRACRRAVCVVVRDDEEPRARGDRIGEEARHQPQIEHAVEGVQALECIIEIGRRLRPRGPRRSAQAADESRRSRGARMLAAAQHVELPPVKRSRVIRPRTGTAPELEQVARSDVEAPAARRRRARRQRGVSLHDAAARAARCEPARLERAHAFTPCIAVVMCGRVGKLAQTRSDGRLPSSPSLQTASASVRRSLVPGCPRASRAPRRGHRRSTPWRKADRARGSACRHPRTTRCSPRARRAPRSGTVQRCACSTICASLKSRCQGAHPRLWAETRLRRCRRLRSSSA